MAVEFIPVFAHLGNGQFVQGKQSAQTTSAPFGQFFSKDNLFLKVFPLTQNTTPGPFTPLAAVSVSGLSLTASIYNSSGSVLATGSSFSVDANEGTLSGNLNCNTPEMAAHVTGDSASVIIEFRFAGSVGAKNVRASATIYKQLNYSGSPTAIPGETFPTVNEMNARCLLRENGAGVGFILTSADNSKRALIYLDNDGALQTEAL